MKFSGKNVLVTGASRGIGAQIAKTLAANGLKVWINYRSGAEEAEAVRAAIAEAGGSAETIGFDVTDEEAFVAAVKRIVEADGELSYLVNNAGITKDKLAMRMKTEEFMAVIEANLKSAFVGCREALKVMGKKRFGAVVNVASIVGESGNAGQSNYSASKGGMIAMTKSFAQEAAPRGIRYNTVTPGFIATEMTDVLKSEIKEAFIAKIPQRRNADVSPVKQTQTALRL